MSHTRNPQLHVDPTTIRDPSLAPYIAASTIGKLTGNDFDDADEVLSTDTAEALREAAKKRADTYDEGDPQSGKTPAAPMGLLALHLLNLKNFDQTAIDEDLSDPNTRFKLLISIGDTYKETGLKKATHKHVHEKDKSFNVLTGVAVDEVKHFSMVIPQQLSDPRNVLRLELYSTSLNADPSTEPRLIGMVEVHIHEIIQAMMIIDVLPLSINNTTVANLYLEFAFMYGALGFLYSTQLENPGFNPNRDLSRTMFPRMSLPEDRDGEVLMPIPQYPPTFIPWTCPVITHWDESVQRTPEGPEPTAPAGFGDQVKGEMQRILADYVPLPCRSDRLAFLRKLVRGSPGPGQSADVAGGGAEEDSRPPSGPADHRSSDQRRPVPRDQRPTAPSGPEPDQDRNDHRSPVGTPDQTAQLRQSSSSTPTQMPALVRRMTVAAAGSGSAAAALAVGVSAASSGQVSAAWLSPRSTPSSSGGPQQGQQQQQQRQQGSRQSMSTDMELPIRGTQRSGSNATKIAAPKQIRRLPLRRPVGVSSSVDKSGDASAENIIDASVDVQ